VAVEAREKAARRRRARLTGRRARVRHGCWPYHDGGCTGAECPNVVVNAPPAHCERFRRPPTLSLGWLPIRGRSFAQVPPSNPIIVSLGRGVDASSSVFSFHVDTLLKQTFLLISCDIHIIRLSINESRSADSSHSLQRAG